MIVDYVLSPKYRPTEREIWLMSRSAENDGIKVTIGLMRAFEKGEIKYLNHTMYKLCRNCMEYKTLDHFYASARYILNKGYICKDCLSIRRRVKKYGTISHVTEVGMQTTASDFGMNISRTTGEILKRRLEDERIYDNPSTNRLGETSSE